MYFLPLNKLFTHFTILDMFSQRLPRSVGTALTWTSRMKGFWCRVADQQSLWLNVTTVEASQLVRHWRICYSILDWTISLTWGHWSSSSRGTPPLGMKFLIASGENQLLDQFCTPQPKSVASKSYEIILMDNWDNVFKFQDEQTSQSKIRLINM